MAVYPELTVCVQLQLAREECAKLKSRPAVNEFKAPVLQPRYYLACLACQLTCRSSHDSVEAMHSTPSQSFVVFSALTNPKHNASINSTTKPPQSVPRSILRANSGTSFSNNGEPHSSDSVAQPALCTD